jgi:pimeloyl-ACP methyl ester carboxylesterase
MLASAAMPYFTHDGRRLAYTIHGDGPRTVVLVHALLMSQKMHRPVARALAARGHRVVTLDLLGHGRSERPRDMTLYQMPFFGQQILGLLDHLELGEAVLGGTSLGANAALEAAASAPERTRGLLIEMPVLDNALLGCAIAFTPLLVSLTFGEPAMKILARAARLVPTGGVWLADVALDAIRQEPGPSGAVLQGIFFGRTAPHRDVRRTLEMPALVIGHRRDPIHPFSDSDALVSELPNARLVRAESFLEMRLTPERLTDELAGFLDECWAPRPAGMARRSARVA